MIFEQLENLKYQYKKCLLGNLYTAILQDPPHPCLLFPEQGLLQSSSEVFAEESGIFLPHQHSFLAWRFNRTLEDDLLLTEFYLKLFDNWFQMW